MLTARNVKVRRGGNDILKGVSLDVRPGELLAIIGPNGAGKSTLLHLLSGDMEADDGTVTLDGRMLRDFSRRDLAQRRAVLPQSSSLAFPFLVQDVVMMGRMPFTIRAETRRDHEIVEAALTHAGIRHLATRRYPTLSGGERQRTHFARALAQIWDIPRREAASAPQTKPGDVTVPPYLLLDEPTASLDLQHQHQLLKLVRDLAHGGAGAVAVIHDLNLALAYADRVAVLASGALHSAGVPEKVIQPAMTAEVFGVTAVSVQFDGRPHLAITGV